MQKVYLIDNSETSDQHLEQLDTDRVEILSKGTNLGIAKALNMALSQAKTDGFKWILTMDQDSFFEPKQFTEFLRNFAQAIDSELSLYAPLHNPKFLSKRDSVEDKEVLIVMSSANIVNIDKALSIGGYDEALFIDEVDHDFCLRLKKRGYCIVQNQNCYVQHSLGCVDASLGMKHYASERLYYMLRNYLYIRKKHQGTFLAFFKERDRYLLKFLYQQVIYIKPRFKRVRYLYQALSDYRAKKMGYRVHFHERG